MFNNILLALQSGLRCAEYLPQNKGQAVSLIEQGISDYKLAAKEIDRLTKENEQLKADYNEACDDAMAAARVGRHRAEKAEADVFQLMSDISTAMRTTRFMDPPDGGDVELPEQVTRMREALEKAEAERDRLREALLKITLNRFGNDRICNTPNNRATCGAICIAKEALNK